MFKNLLVYRLAPEWRAELSTVQAALDRQRFVECGATQPQSLGWVPPRDVEHAPLVESVDGQWLARVMVEQKIVPSSVIKREVDERARKIEADTGRAPGGKLKRDLKDQALLDLLPRAFTKRAGTTVWISPQHRLLVIDASSTARADAVLTLLTEALPGFAAQHINTEIAPAAAMAEWLVAGEAPSPFTVDRETELKAAEGEKPAVRYARHDLDLDEVRGHIQAGKRPTRLALTWNARVSFVLTDGLQIKRLAFEDGVFERQPGASRDDNFDADAAISTGELVPLIGDLIDALGGEAVGIGQAPSAAAPAAAAATARVEPPAQAQAEPGSTPSPRGSAAGGTAARGGDVPPWEDAA